VKDTDLIYKQDCLKGMRERLVRESVDVVVTSPPYNIGVAYNVYDDNREFSAYCQWIEAVFRQCERVLASDGSIFLNLGERPSDQLRVFEVVRPLLKFLKLQNTIHWIKSIAAPEFGVNVGHYKPVQSKRYLHCAHEYIFHLTKTGNVKLDILGNGCEYADKSNIGRYAIEDRRSRGDTWYIPYATVISAKKHPAEFPVHLPEWCIKLHGVKRTRLVLDPFMGTGATALAAKRLGKAYIGFEIDEAYHAEALRRLEALEKSMGLTSHGSDAPV
jgi:site-specific DNA-methyltransferase (adenine-specific)